MKSIIISSAEMLIFSMKVLIILSYINKIGVEIVKNHIDSFKTFQPKPKPSTFILNDKPKDLTDLLSKLQAKVNEFRIRVREFLRDFDSLRSGAIT